MTTLHAIRVSKTGGAEVLEYVEVPRPSPKDGEVLVRIEAAGVNFIDVYHRTGLYKMELPYTPGSEAAGVVVETGERVAYAMAPGAYADLLVLDGNPLDDIRVLTTPASRLKLIMKGGQVYKNEL